MIIKKETRDLISDNNCYFVQCISNKFASATGVLDNMNRTHNIKKSIQDKYGNDRISVYPYNEVVLCNNKVFDIIIYSKNSNDSIYEYLERVFYKIKTIFLNKEYREILDKKILAFPDSWYGIYNIDMERVIPILEKVFGDTNLEIIYN